MAEQFRDERVARVYRYWQERRGSRAAPLRSDINPIELGNALPIAHLIDVLRDPLRFRHRLVGTELAETMGRDVTGRLIEDGMYGAATAEVIHSLERIVAELRPFVRRARLDWCGRDWMLLESVELPLLDADGRVGTILRAASGTKTRSGAVPRLEFLPL